MYYFIQFMLLISLKYNKRPQEDYENICISKLEQCGFRCFIVPLEKERKEVSEMVKDDMVSFEKLKNSPNQELNSWTNLLNV